MIGLLTVASAQTTANVQHFGPTGAAQGFASVPSARQLRGRGGAFEAIADYAHRPLQRSALVDGVLQRDAGAIDSLFAFHARAAYGVTDFLELAVDAPFLQVTSTDQAILDLGGQSTILATGDLCLSASVRPLSEAAVGVALVPFATLPSGSAGAFLSFSEPTFGGRLVVSKAVEPVHVAANVGYRVVRTGGYLDTTVGIDDEVLYGGGLGFTLLPDRARFNVEVVGSQVVGKARQLANPSPIQGALHAPLELLGDARVDLDNGVSLVFGGGPGLSPAVGTPTFRAFVGLGWRTPPDRDSDGDGFLDRFDGCEEQPEDRDGFQDEDGCPDPDNDADTIPDRRDRCPMEPEDFDSYQDTDGCPEPDNDLDGIPDGADGCPMQPEDVDGVDDFDGCPDYATMVVDTDGDGVQDQLDNCISRPEDYDGFLDTDGCPDPDNDVDYIPDTIDLCPLEPETVNGFQDEDGCPDTALVTLTAEQIIIHEQVNFLTGKAVIIESSHPLLEAVLQILVDHPEILRVKIEGHTDSRGSNAYNLDLSTKRANAIRDFLVQRGVEPSRLEAEGFGEFSPLVPNDSEENMLLNRRVEFHILEQR